MALDTLRSILGQRCAMYFFVATGILPLVLVPYVGAQPTNRDSQPFLRTAAVPTTMCPSDELSTLRKIIPMFIQWHYARHAEWLQDEVVDPILEAIAKEEEGLEGTAIGRGPNFRLLLAILQAADGGKAEQVKADTPARILLENLHNSAASRKQEVVRLQDNFEPYLNCLNEHRTAIEYLTELNKMPHFPDPIVNPAGEIGRFIGSFMRKHILVDHEAIIQGILLAALYAHQRIQSYAKRSPTSAASLKLLEKALTNLKPKIVYEVHQVGGNKAFRNLREGRAELKKSQDMAIKELVDSFCNLPTDPKNYQEVFKVLVPSSYIRPC